MRWPRAACPYLVVRLDFDLVPFEIVDEHVVGGLLVTNLRAPELAVPSAQLVVVVLELILLTQLEGGSQPR